MDATTTTTSTFSLHIDSREVALLHEVRRLASTVAVFRGMAVHAEPLPLGDAVVRECDRECDRECLIIERKTVADLLASITDGRYEEQSYRLNGLSLPNHNIVYLVEGVLSAAAPKHKASGYGRKQQKQKKEDMSCWLGGHMRSASAAPQAQPNAAPQAHPNAAPQAQPNAAPQAHPNAAPPGASSDEREEAEPTITPTSMLAYSALFSLQHFKGFSTMRTLSLGETALVLCNMVYKLTKDCKTKRSYYSSASPSIATPAAEDADGDEDAAMDVDDEPMPRTATATATATSYVHVVKKIKKDNITAQNIGELMLCQIPGISSVTAEAVMQRYHTIAGLLQAHAENPATLHGLSYVNAKGQHRKVSKASLANIVAFLVPDAR